MPASPLPRKGDSWVHISSIIRIIHGAAGGWHRNHNLLSYLQLSPVPHRYTALDRSLRTRYASHTRGSTHRSERTCAAARTHPTVDSHTCRGFLRCRLAPAPRPPMGHATPSQASVWVAAPSQAERREPVIASPDPDITSIPAAVYLYRVPGSHRGSWYPVDPAAFIPGEASWVHARPLHARRRICNRAHLGHRLRTAAPTAEQVRGAAARCSRRLG